MLAITLATDRVHEKTVSSKAKVSIVKGARMFDVASQYTWALDEDTEKSSRLFLLLWNLEKYVNGSIIEMRRLSRAKWSINRKFRKLNTESPTKKDFHLTYLALDAHFYFICIDKVYKLLLALAEELDNDQDIKKLAERLNKVIDIKKVRDHLEHIDARCRGFSSLSAAKKGNRQPIRDFGNFWGDDFSFDGDRFPLGKDSLRELKAIYRDLIDILRNKYASKNEHYIRQEYQRQYSQYLNELGKQIMRELESKGLLQN